MKIILGFLIAIIGILVNLSLIKAKEDDEDDEK